MVQDRDTAPPQAAPAGVLQAMGQGRSVAAGGGTAALDYQLIELLFFAYRDFVGDADQVLERFGFGRAHHRVLYFVDRQPGMTVAELLETLRITKQSLARVLKQLVDDGFVLQETGPLDRRQRLLSTTSKGRDLVHSLAQEQSARIGRALAGAGPDARRQVAAFLGRMVDESLAGSQSSGRAD